MHPTVHIIAQCTDRKRADVPPNLRLRSVVGASIAERAAKWRHRLVSHCGERVPVRALYAGEHWTAVTYAFQKLVSAGHNAHLWVASAGYGFVAAGEMVAPYSATFARGTPDSVHIAGEDFGRQNADWWRALGTSSRLIGLAEADRSAAFVFVISPAYLEAVSEDLERLRAHMVDADQLAIVCSCEPRAVSVRGNWIQSVARLRSVVGGTQIGLHARVAARLLDVSKGRVSARLWQGEVSSWLDSSPQPIALDRVPMRDDEVRTFVRTTRTDSWSRALRELRSSGRACEQKRFRQLFLEERSA